MYMYISARILQKLSDKHASSNAYRTPGYFEPPSVDFTLS